MKTVPHLAVDARMLRNSGVGVYLRSLLPRLASLLTGWRFTIIGSVEALAQLDWSSSAHVDFVQADAPIYSVREQWHVPLRVPARVDGLWVPHYNIPLLFRGRLVVTIHDVLHLARPEFVGGGLHRRAYARLMFNRVAARASKVLTDSDFSKSELLRLTHVQSERIHRVYPGVGPEWGQTTRGTDGNPYVVYVGNVKPHKNLRTLVDGFGLLSKQLPHRLVVVGQFEGLRTGDPALFELVQSTRTRVEFVGLVDDVALRKLVAGAEALVLPSLYEGFGLPPLEAMACGCPVLVSRCASLPEVCGDAAHYCDASDPADLAQRLSELLTDPSLRAALRARGHVRSRAFTWEECAAGTAAVLEEAVAA